MSNYSDITGQVYMNMEFSEFQRYSEQNKSRMLSDKQCKETEQSVPTGATLLC